MRKILDTTPAKPFFLETDSGKRFCLYHTPHPSTQSYGTFIYIHPFGEEMNKSRRMAALQARAFSNIGYSVLQIDLFGCGDSFGEFNEARWDIWKQDISFATKWLKKNSSTPIINLWGLRLGALLALDFACNSDDHIDNILLWQPVLNGKSFLTQFLRLQLVNKLLSDNYQRMQGIDALRSSLAAGSTLEVAGYDLASELAAAIDTLKISDLVVLESNVHWFDVVADTNQSITPTKAEVMKKWKNDGNSLYIHPISCLYFWATQEITECPELITATTQLFTKNHHEH